MHQHAYIHKKHTYIHIYTINQTYTNTLIQTHTYTYMCACIQAHIHTFIIIMYVKIQNMIAYVRRTMYGVLNVRRKMYNVRKHLI